jgi:hypothetical protein
MPTIHVGYTGFAGTIHVPVIILYAFTPDATTAFSAVTVKLALIFNATQIPTITPNVTA